MARRLESGVERLIAEGCVDPIQPSFATKLFRSHFAT